MKSIIAGVGLGLAALSASAQSAVSPVNLPLYFEAASANNFFARGQNSEFLITPVSAQIALRKSGEGLLPVSMEFIGANPAATVSGGGKLPGQVNYLVGSDASQWRSGIPTFSQVRVTDIYPGIGLVYYGNNRQIEYDFTIAPGAKPETIAIRFDGADKISINDQGELVLKAGSGEIRQPKPVIYQTINSTRHEIAGGYQIADARSVKFSVGQYDTTAPLVIDPVLEFSTYFGGTAGETAWAVTMDTNGFVYIAGQTFSTLYKKATSTNAAIYFRELGGFQTNYAGGKLTGDAFITKFDSTGNGPYYLTYLGGKGNDFISGIAVDGAGHAFVTGYTDSPNFPTNHPLYPVLHANLNNKSHIYPGDAFVAELETNGSSLIYSTYLGGSGVDSANGIALDSAGNAYITGVTASTNFPTTNAITFQLSGSTNLVLDRLAGTNNAFVAEISAGGSNLIYASYLGGNRVDVGQAIAVDSADYVYVAGFTVSTNFPTFNAISSLLNNNTTTNRNYAYDGFVSKFAPGGTNFIYSTYLGGTNNDYAYRIAVDLSGNAYVTGSTLSSNFPNTVNLTNLTSHVGTNSVILPRDSDAFLTKFDTNGAIVYSAIFGGRTNDIGYGVAVDAAGDAFVVGTTTSTNFPTYSATGFSTNSLLRATNSGGSDIFVTAFKSDASLLYSVLIGGKGNDYGYNIAADPAGNVFVVGQTASTNFPVTAGVFQNFRNGTNDSFLIKIIKINP